MSGIDRADQMISYYPIPRKSFFHVMDVCLWNGNHLYNTQVKDIPHLDFRKKVASHLIGLNSQPSTPPISMTNMHTPKKIEIRKKCIVLFIVTTLNYV